MSIVENPKPHGMSYNRWQRDVEKLSNRDRLCLDMDEALAKKPHSFEAFLSLMEQAGYTVTRGKNITFSHPRQKRNIRMRSLPEEYQKDAICEVLLGKRIHNPRKRRSPLAEQKPQLVSSLEAKRNQGRGQYYDGQSRTRSPSSRPRLCSIISSMALPAWRTLRISPYPSKKRKSVGMPCPHRLHPLKNAWVRLPSSRPISPTI